jgi:hypothetical protein
MLGWEFLPFISGGLGTACYGLTKAMSKLGAEIVFVLSRSTAGDQVSPIVLPGSRAVPTPGTGMFARVKFCERGYSLYSSPPYPLWFALLRSRTCLTIAWYGTGST